LTAPEAAELTGMKPQRVSDLRGTLENEDLYRQVLVGPVYRRAYLREGDPRVHLNTGHIEWYTPAEYIELARQVLGGFDLDPASNEVAQATVRAQRYYSRDDSSLPHQWHGRVWMNPPYSRPLINQMMEKLCEEYAAGRVTGAIVLVNSCTEVKWFQECCTVARALCFPNKRIQFYNPEGKGGGPLQGQTFFYFGDATEVFAAAFKGIGVIVVPHA
jgi:ParB family chromosome partitioning protein